MAQIPNLFILSSTGEVLIEKHWISKEKRTVVEVYTELASKISPKTDIPPIIQSPKHYYFNLQRWNLTFLVVGSKECQPLFIIELLGQIIEVLVEYFTEINETIIRENFSIIYQLLDEMIDGGFAATLELNQLKEMILPPSLARKLINTVTGEFSVSSNLSLAAVSKIPWRKTDVKYVTNEIYFDLIEQIDAIFGANQQLISGAIYGEIKTNCKLSGMPDLTLSFTKPQLLDDVSLHKCVRINRYQREKVISFVPPDGNFNLLSYRINNNINIPIYVKPMITFKNGSGKIHVMVGSKNTGDKPVTNVVIYIPMPNNTKTHTLHPNVGSVRFDSSNQMVKWDIGRIPKELTPVLEGGVILNDEKTPDEAPTLRAEFQVKMYCASGLKVDGLAIRGVNYRPFKGVRSITQAGRFQVRSVDT